MASTEFVENPLDTFPQEVTEAVDGLLWLGHLETEVEFCGHSFHLHTLKASEELQVALLAKDYIDTYGQVKANIWAHIAASLQAVDGNEDFCPAIGPNQKDHVRAKFNYITSNWYWPVGDYLFGEYTKLVVKQSEAIKAIEDLYSRSLSTSWPSSDSSIEAGDSQETSTASSSSASPS